jgi:hypothetical protein
MTVEPFTVHVRRPRSATCASALRHMPLLSRYGRLRQPAIRQRLAQLDAPASLWEDAPNVTIADGAHADGRALLLRLSAWYLWLDRHHPTATTHRPDPRTTAT